MRQKRQSCCFKARTWRAQNVSSRMRLVCHLGGRSLASLVSHSQSVAFYRKELSRGLLSASIRGRRNQAHKVV